MTILSKLNQRVNAITADSRMVKTGALFLAYKGAQSDGRDYIPQAIKAGASVVIWDNENFTWQAAWQVKNVGVTHLKTQISDIAAEFYDYPSRQLSVVGVTGTNGKTSVSQWVAQCLTFLGEKTAVIGTIGSGVLVKEKLETEKCAYEKPLSPAQKYIGLSTTNNTTPDAILLQGMLAEFVQQQVAKVAMEVSSHGLDQARVNGVKFDIAVLTNLTQDHLDYHGSMQAYADAKRKLFKWASLKAAILNTDDAFGQQLCAELKAAQKKVITYGFNEEADVRGTNLMFTQTGLAMQVATPKGFANIQANVLGRFNADNILAVLGTLLALEISLENAVEAIGNIQPIQGRMQQFGGGDLPLVVIDYAHTPDALEKVLNTLKDQLQKTDKLICVFGCGGNRDKTKRPMMGSIALTIADEVIVTSDNPRDENPLTIIAEIVATQASSFLIEADRETAITRAIAIAKAGDIVLIAGKGHEDYQEIAGVKVPFSDMAVVEEKLNSFAISGEKLNGFSQTHFAGDISA